MNEQQKQERLRALMNKRVQRAVEQMEQALPGSEIKPAPRTEDLPLSILQQTVLRYLWFNTDARHVPICRCFRLQGELNVEAMERCLNELARRHETLRTTYPLIDGKPAQVIAPALHLTLAVLDLQDVPESGRMEEALRSLSEELAQPYNLSTEPLWRFRLVRLGERDHILFLTLDHLIADDWAMDVLVEDIQVLYAAFARGSASPLKDIPIQFADFAYWQKQLLEGQSFQELRRYWEKQLEEIGLWPELHLPFERLVNSPSSEMAATTQSFELSEELTDSLRELSSRYKVTLFVMLLAVLVALLYRYTGKLDIGIPSTVANRSRPETRSIVGWLSDLLVFHFKLSGINTFAELLQHVYSVVVDAYEHQDLPYSKFPGYRESWWIEAIYPCIRFNMTATLERPASPEETQSDSPPALSISPIVLPYFNGENSIKPGMSVNILEGGTTLTIQPLYEIERYAQADIIRFLENFRDLAQSIVNAPEQRLEDLPMPV